MVTARLVNLPHDVHGFTALAEDGTPIIVLNARDSRERNRQSYLHELRHIDHGDLYCHEKADAVEYRSNKKSHPEG
jgi:Zn-dependent peptidase ImmA (M78 family)